MHQRVDSAQQALGHVLRRIEDSPFRHESVNPTVSESWQRAAGAGLRPDLIHPPYDSDLDDDSKLRWAAAPPMTAVSADLPDIPSALLLIDRRVHVIDRWARTTRTALQMDAVGAAPGFFCNETVIGTNSIGMAATTRGMSLVRGFEHYADALVHVTCASRAVVDPFTGQLLGVVNLTIADPAPSHLMLALVGRVVHETQQRLLDETGTRSLLVYDAFLQARRRWKGPVAAVDRSAIYINPAARRLVASTDRETIWTWAQACARSGSGPVPTLELPEPTPVATCEPVRDGSDLIGAVVHFAASDRPARATKGDQLLSLTDSELSVARSVANGLTNRETAAELFISPHTVDYHLRHIFRKLDVDSRVQLARIVAPTIKN